MTDASEDTPQPTPEKEAWVPAPMGYVQKIDADRRVWCGFDNGTFLVIFTNDHAAEPHTGLRLSRDALSAFINVAQRSMMRATPMESVMKVIVEMLDVRVAKSGDEPSEAASSQTDDTPQAIDEKDLAQ